MNETNYGALEDRTKAILGIGEDKPYSKMTEDEVEANISAGEPVDFENARTISGEDIAPPPTPEQYIQAAVTLFAQIDEQGYTLKELASFEQVMVGVMVRMFKLMQEKQRGYGKSNISKAGLHGLFTRATDKIERAKNIVGDPVENVDKIKAVLTDETYTEARKLSVIDKLVNPETYADESVDDTLIDLANYGLIMYMVQSDSWGKDMEDGKE